VVRILAYCCSTFLMKKACEVFLDCLFIWSCLSHKSQGYWYCFYFFFEFLHENWWKGVLLYQTIRVIATFFSCALLRIYSHNLIFQFQYFFINSLLRVILWLIIYTSSFRSLGAISVGFFEKSLTVSEIWSHKC